MDIGEVGGHCILFFGQGKISEMSGKNQGNVGGKSGKCRGGNQGNVGGKIREMSGKNQGNVREL